MLIDWDEVVRLCPTITGVIHCGAYRAEERKYYKNLPTKWIEADPELFDALRVEDKHWFAATNFHGTIGLNVMKFRPANSLLWPNLNAKRRSDVKVIDTVEVPAREIREIQEPGYNFLNLDIQGAELNALKGCDLSQFDAIYTEAHEVETYINCTQIEELDNYLSGYHRVASEWTKYGWGDVLYVRYD